MSAPRRSVSHKMPPPRSQLGGGIPFTCSARFVRSRQAPRLLLHALLVVVATVVLAAVAIFVTGGAGFATAAITVPVAFPRQLSAGDVLESVSTVALAVPLAVAVGLAVLTGQIGKRADSSTGQQTADTCGPRRLQQSSPTGAGRRQLEQRIKRFAVHTVLPVDDRRRRIVTQRHPPRARAGAAAIRAQLLLHPARENGLLPGSQPIFDQWPSSP